MAWHLKMLYECVVGAANSFKTSQECTVHNQMLEKHEKTFHRVCLLSSEGTRSYTRKIWFSLCGYVHWWYNVLFFRKSFHLEQYSLFYRKYSRIGMVKIIHHFVNEIEEARIPQHEIASTGSWRTTKGIGFVDSKYIFFIYIFGIPFSSVRFILFSFFSFYSLSGYFKLRVFSFLRLWLVVHFYFCNFVNGIIVPDVKQSHAILIAQRYCSII